MIFAYIIHNTIGATFSRKKDYIVAEFWLFNCGPLTPYDDIYVGHHWLR